MTPSFSAFIDCLYGAGSDPWALTGDRTSSRVVRLREYEQCPECLGEYYVPAFHHQAYLSLLQACREQPTVRVEELSSYWDNGIPAIARTNALCMPNNVVHVLEHDSLIIPAGKDLAAYNGIPMDELKHLQPQVVYQAAMATGMPHSAMVWSGSKSVHVYLVAADPEHWPERPPSLGDTRGLPAVLVNELRQRQRAKSEGEREGRYNRWYAWQYLLYLVTGRFDTQVFAGAGQGTYVRTPMALRDNGRGHQQALLSVQRPISWDEHWEWLLAQVSPEAREWALAKAQGGAKELKKTPELRTMLRLDDPGGWKDMVVRRVQQGGEHVEEQALTRQVLSVVAELHGTQRPPEIVRRPNLEQGDWGDIRASFLWWVSFLTMNHLSIPWTTTHAEAPTPVGWVFTGLDWWWEDKGGKPNRIREVWKPGNEGDWHQRLGQAKEDFAVNYWLEHEQEYQETREKWAASGWSARSAPQSALVPGHRIQLAKPPTEKVQREGRSAYFIASLGIRAVRTTEQCMPYMSQWMVYDGKLWSPVSIERLYEVANDALVRYPEMTAKGDIKPITEKAQKETIVLAYSQSANQCIDHRTEWRQREGTVIFPNGTLYLNVQTGTYEFKAGHFDPDDWATFAMPSDYNPDMLTPAFDNYMATSFVDPHDRENIMQFLGYILDPQADQKAWLMVVGDADTGKTTLQKLITCIVGGPEHIIAPNLDSMTRDNYWAAGLPKARVISIDEKTDTSPREQKQVAALIKQITGDGQITVRQMNKNPFAMPVNAKLVMTCNVQPDFKDDSDAFWKRLIIVRPSLPPTIDRKLMDKLQAELPGIMPKLIAAWARMRRNGGFERSQSQIEDMREYREANSPLIEFFNEWMVKDEEACCYVRAILETYNRVRDGGFRSEGKFVRALRDTMKLRIGRYTKEEMRSLGAAHLPADKYTPNTGYLLRGWRCAHPIADTAAGHPEVAPDLRGSQDDPTLVPMPRRTFTPRLVVP